MNSAIVGATFLLVVVVSSALAWPYEDEYSAWKLARSSRRSHSCVGSSGKCFSTVQCCHGFVCAAFDDYFGANPEVPGLCVKEKDLQPCYSSRECEFGSQCVSLGRDGEKYCVAKSSGVQSAARTSSSKASGNGRVGTPCKRNSDCRDKDKDDSPLCCQPVNLGRQGRKVICDRITDWSECID